MVQRRSNKRTRSKRGGSIQTWLSKAHNFIKKHKVASRLIHHGSKKLPFMLQPVGTAVRNAIARRGYGRKRISKRGGTFRLAGSGVRVGGRVY